MSERVTTDDLLSFSGLPPDIRLGASNSMVVIIGFNSFISP